MEEKLVDTINLLESVYSSLDEAVFVVNHANRLIISCNDAAEKIFGYSRGEMIGRNTEFLHEDGRAYHEFGERLIPALKKKGFFHTEYNMKKKNGTVFPTDHTVKEVKGDSGKQRLVVSVVRDITTQKKAYEELDKKEESLRLQNIRLEELNTALKVLLDQRDKDIRNIESSFADNINTLIIPYLYKIRKSGLEAMQEEYINILESNLRELIKPYMHRINDKLNRLSPSETRIVNYIRQGYRIKEIAELLKVSERTIEFHRANIRNKLGIKNRKINLKTYLSKMS